MSRYLLTRRIYKTLLGREYILICKICNNPLDIAMCLCSSEDIIRVNDEKFQCQSCGFIGDVLSFNGCVESKPSKYRKRKFYHCKCYDESFIDTDNGSDES